MRTNIIGALLGLACGDSLCGDTQQQGEPTANMARALCVAEGILAKPDRPKQEIGRRFLQGLPSHVRDTDRTTCAVVSHYQDSWSGAASAQAQTVGNSGVTSGSLVRTLPIALAYIDKATMLKQSARISGMTHWSAQAEVCCAVYCLFVQGLLQGGPRREAWRAAVGATKRHVQKYGKLASDTPGPTPLPDGFWERLNAVGARRYDQLQPIGQANLVVDCLEAAVWCVLNGDSLEQSVILAINLGGDTGTIAVLVGGAVGAFWGEAGIPARWKAKLPQRDQVRKTAERLADLRRHLEVYATKSLLTRPFEFEEVADGILAGRHPLTAWDVDRLVEAGVTCILDLREALEWAAPDRFGLEALAAIERRKLRRLHLPVPNTYAPTPADLNAAWETLSAWLAEPHTKIYVHCKAGRERTATVVTAYYARKHGVSYDQALALLQAKRPVFQPQHVQEVAVRQWLKPPVSTKPCAPAPAATNI